MDRPIEIKCPKCGAAMQITFRQALESATVECSNCHRSIQLKPDASVQRSLDDVDEAERSLRRTIENLGR
jgi:uncharacterized Zn finger protein